MFEAGYSTARQGTGLGLAIVEEIANAHGWTITVTDGRDGGARFEVSGVTDSLLPAVSFEGSSVFPDVFD